MNCLHCEEPIQGLDPFVALNAGTAFMHAECNLRGVVGSADHIRRGPHAVGECEPDDPKLTKRQAALEAVSAWREATHGGVTRDTSMLDVKDLDDDELRAEVAMRSAAFETPGYFSRWGEDAGNVEAAFRFRLASARAMLDEREWPRQLGEEV